MCVAYAWCACACVYINCLCFCVRVIVHVFNQCNMYSFQVGFQSVHTPAKYIASCIVQCCVSSAEETLKTNEANCHQPCI